MFAASTHDHTLLFTDTGRVYYKKVREPSGSAGASHLTAGTVRNGPLPGVYIDSSDVRGASLRLRLEVTDADSDGDFEGTFYLEYNEVLP